MSFYPNSPQNTTGLGYAPPKPGEKMSGVTVLVQDRDGVQPESYELTQAQEDFAQKVAKSGAWEEMPHKSGRRQIRQRVLDILMEKQRAGGSSTSVVNVVNQQPKAKSKTEYVFLAIDGGGSVLGAFPLKSQAKDHLDPYQNKSWTNNKHDADATDGSKIRRVTVRKPRA